MRRARPRDLEDFPSLYLAHPQDLADCRHDPADASTLLWRSNTNCARHARRNASRDRTARLPGRRPALADCASSYPGHPLDPADYCVVELRLRRALTRKPKWPPIKCVELTLGSSPCLNFTTEAAPLSIQLIVSARSHRPHRGLARQDRARWLSCVRASDAP
jgi:hypothetical protein